MANLIVNGGFEIASPGTTAPGADGDTLLPGGSTAIDGWTIIGGPAGDDQLYWFGSGFDGLSSPDADAVALTGDINKNPEFGVEQTIATTPGMTYALTFDVGTSTNFADPSGAGVSVTAGNLTTTITGIITNGTDVWTPEEVDFTATSTATAIVIQGDAPLPDGSGEYVGLDDVAVNPTTNTAPPGNLITNGSFEQASPLTALPILPGTQAGAYEGSTLTSSSTAILGWTITGSGAVNWIPDNSETPETSPFGVYFLNLADNTKLENGNLGGAPFDGVTQTIATTPGTTYQLTFDLGNDNTASNTGILPTGNGIAETSGSAAMPGWTVIGGTATGNDGLAWLSNANSYGPTAETGSYFVSLAGYLDNSPYFGVAQTIATTAGQSYELTFYLGVDNGNVRYTGPIGVSVTAGPVTQTIENVSPTGTGNQWVEETVDFTATEATSTISIQGLQGDQYIGLDNVSVVQTGTGTNLITNGDFAEPSINPVGVSVTAGPGTTTFNDVDPTNLGNAWTPETLDFTATSTTSTIAIQADQGQNYVGLDNVAVTVAPPSGPVTGGVFSEDGTIDTFTVPISGSYVIDAVGATGGGLGPGYAGGAGADVDGTFTLTAGDVLEILVGGAGTSADGGAGSGGGGSFVFDSTTDTLLEAAGGGGGASAGSGGTGSAGGPGGAGQAGTSGTAGGDYVNGFGVSPGGAGGADGSGGGVGTLTTNPAGTGSGGGGGGFSGSGGNGEFGDGGTSFLAGGTGGTGASLDTQHNGGFGGGGGANSDSIGAGGGGGFSGGGGGEENVGGGGGSFIAQGATDVTLTGGENADGNGSVTITAATTGPDVFEQTTPASSGPLTGLYLWSNAANWTNGVPVDGESVSIAVLGYDDTAALSLASLTLSAAGGIVVTGASLDATAVAGSSGTRFVADAFDAGAPVTVTVQSITGTGGLYGTQGVGATFMDQSTVDHGETYAVDGGGLVELAASPSGSSTLIFDGAGTFALETPGASNGVAISDLAAGDTLELPGSSVSGVSFGTASLSVTTSAGTYAFSNVTYNTSAAPTGFTASHDSTTGLEAITFTGPDIFEQNAAASSGPFTGSYLWSNAANWSSGVPSDGATVTTESGTSLLYTHGIDDIQGLSLAAFTQAPFSVTEIVADLAIATLTNDGTIQVDSPTALTISGAVSGTGVIVDDPSTIQLDDSVSAGQTVSLVGAGSVLKLGDPQQFEGTISGFTLGDVLDLTNVGLGSIISKTFTNDVLTLNTNNGSITLKFADSPNLSLQSFNLTPLASGTEMTEPGLLCFTAGTRILTPCGEIPVETLKIGDSVKTLNGEDRAIKWIGIGRVLATRGRRNAATPVIVRKSALADNVPHCDLRITKGHSLYLDDVLIPVEFLVNHRSIVWDDIAQEVALYHIELESHDVLLANGAPAESYRDDGNRWLFCNANAGWSMPPQPSWAPVLTGGATVDAVWRRLLERSGPRPGHPLTDDPDLHLLADDARLNAVSRLAGVYIFALPNAPERLRVVSRAGAPAELGLARDPRVLGVALRSIVVRQGSRFSILGAADARLIDGFHAHEPELDMRWTDGDAAVPSELFVDFSGPVELVLHVGVTAQYLDDGDARRAA